MQIKEVKIIKVQYYKHTCNMRTRGMLDDNYHKSVALK